MFRKCLRFWRWPVFYLSPVILLAIPFCYGSKESYCMYVASLMSIYWVTEAIPLSVTALLPVILFPLFGILDSKEVTVQYMKENNMMFLGGLIVAVAIEHCDLHKRIALRILLTVGTSIRKLLAGIMLTSMFLSMWISNTSSTAMMLPITKAIVQTLEEQVSLSPQDLPIKDDVVKEISLCDNGNVKSTKEDTEVGASVEVPCTDSKGKQKRLKSISTMLLLGTSYSALLGGCGTLTGSGTNVILAAVIEDFYGSETSLSYATWMFFNVPLMLVNVVCLWLWLQFVFIGLRSKTSDLQSSEQKAALRRILQSQYDELGKMNYHQGMTTVLFVSLIFLWLFRDPKFIPGWRNFFPEKKVGDSAPAILIAALFFSLPSNMDFFKSFFSKGSSSASLRPPGPLLPWKVAQQRLPWNIIFLMGGGYALAKGFEASGLSAMIGHKLYFLENLQPLIIIIVITIATSLFTEIISNAATANIIMPILAKVAEALHVNPLYLMLPAAVACSYAFVLPVGTPPNALVYAESDIKVSDMARTGIVVNFICIFVLIIAIHTLGYLIFDFKTFPQWAIEATTSLDNTTIIHKTST